MKTILTTTYAVNPYKGSEDAMGWNYVYQIARFHKVIAVTRENNRPHIEQYMSQYPNELYQNMTFLYFDLPKYKRFWKRGSRGAMLYFLLWQKGIVNFVKNQKIDFDIAHNLNFHNDWTPSFLWKLNKPFVWGPIGHHPQISSIYSKTMDLKTRLKNEMAWIVKNYFWKHSSALKNTIENASYIWCMNDSVPKVLNLTNKRYHVSPSVATQDFGCSFKSNEYFHVLSAGRLVHMKGFDLTINSFAKFLEKNVDCKAHLTIVGDGPEKKNLLTLIELLKIGEHVSIIHWMERDSLMKVMRDASVFLFPSHEGAGMVVPEALSFGLPILTIDNCGPGQFVSENYGFVIGEETYEATINGLAEGLSVLYRDEDKFQAMRQAARKAFEEKFHWDRRGEQLKKLYETI